MIFSFPTNFIIILKKACTSPSYYSIEKLFKHRYANLKTRSVSNSSFLNRSNYYPHVYLSNSISSNHFFFPTIIPQTITSSQFKLIIFKTTGIGDTSNERSQFANKIKRCSSIAPTCKLGIISNSIAENSKVMSPASLRTKLGESSRIPKQVKYPQRNFQRSVQLNDDAPSDETLYS